MTDVMSTAQYNDLARRRMSEAVWQAQVLQILRSSGWMAFHPNQSTRGTGHTLRGDADMAGWPDVTAVRNDHHRSRTAWAFLELKKCATPAAQAKQLSTRQREVLQLLGESQLIMQGTDNLAVHVGVLRPTDIDLLCDLADDPWSVDPDTVPSR